MHHALHDQSKIIISNDPFRSLTTHIITIIPPFLQWAQLPYYVSFKIVTPSTLPKLQSPPGDGNRA